MSESAEAIQQLVDYIATGELNKAEKTFHDVLGTKLSDSLDAQRIATAQEIFNEVDDEEEIVEYDDEDDIEEEDIEDDDDLEDYIDDLDVEEEDED